MFVIYRFTLRGRAEAARKAHNLEVGGSIPPPATKKFYKYLVI
jgi:hypothetical protein